MSRSGEEMMLELASLMGTMQKTAAKKDDDDDKKDKDDDKKEKDDKKDDDKDEKDDKKDKDEKDDKKDKKASLIYGVVANLTKLATHLDALGASDASGLVDDALRVIVCNIEQSKKKASLGKHAADPKPWEKGFVAPETPMNPDEAAANSWTVDNGTPEAIDRRQKLQRKNREQAELGYPNRAPESRVGPTTGPATKLKPLQQPRRRYPKYTAQYQEMAKLLKVPYSSPQAVYKVIKRDYPHLVPKGTTADQLLSRIREEVTVQRGMGNSWNAATGTGVTDQDVYGGGQGGMSNPDGSSGQGQPGSGTPTV